MKAELRSKHCLVIALIITLFPALAWANPKANELKVIETPDAIEIHTQASTAEAAEETPGSQATVLATSQFDPLKYTLGPDDVVEVTVMRHPEFSGIYPINQEGKLQYKFVGDIDVSGMTKLELEQKLKEIISSFVIAPEVNVTVIEYKSKVFYVLGEVGTPGRFYMRSEAIPVREAVFQAGLPTFSAAMRKCQIITPDKKGNAKVKSVNLYSILYKGNLAKNIDLHPGDILYVPSTIMAKVIRVINPVASTIGVASSAPEGVSTGKAAVTSLGK